MTQTAITLNIHLGDEPKRVTEYDQFVGVNLDAGVTLLIHSTEALDTLQVALDEARALLASATAKGA